MSFRERRHEAGSVNVLMPEYDCGIRLGGGAQACLVSPECRREGGEPAAEAAVHSLMAWAVGAGSQVLIRLAGSLVCVGGGRISIPS